MDSRDLESRVIEISMEEEWVEPFRRELGFHGRPTDKHRWYIVWARKFTAGVIGRSLRQVTREDVEGFLGTLPTSPGIAA